MLRIKCLSETAKIPTLADADAAGYDLYSSVEMTITPGTRNLVKTDIAMDIPENHYGQIKSRSSIAWKNKVDVGAGVIDRNYRGEIKVLLINMSNETFHINVHDRIAQIVFIKYSTFTVENVDQLSETSRGSFGFGSTGK